MRTLRIALLCLLAFPAAARAGEATITSREVPLHGARSLAAATPSRFDLVGLHWQGSGTVSFRTRGLDGRWSPWRQAAPEAEDLPDRRSPEAAQAGRWRLGNPWWTGAANGIQYHLHGTVTRLKAWFVRSPVLRVPARVTATAGSPPVVDRAGWGADETIVRHGPAYADAIRFAVVHHTAGANGYGPAESAAIVRGIELYHVQGNGWNDVGYNFLVDKYGTVYEGRAGGVERNVVGAHAEGFNTGSVGIAVLGNYETGTISKAAEDALARLLAWRLDVAHVDPLSTLSAISGGNQRFAAGLPVFLRAVSGHRDTGFTECPGDSLYARLNALAGAAATIGAPKLYEPQVEGAVGGSVRFRARLTAALPWTVSVTDAAGAVAASGTGFGTDVDWTWNATGLTPVPYAWSISAGPTVRGASGAFGVAALPVAVTGVVADPETISPNYDGQADESTVTYSLSKPATVQIDALDLIGEPVAVLQGPLRQAAGQHAYRFTGSDLQDAAYQLRITAHDDDGKEAAGLVQVAVTRTLGGLDVAPSVFSPNLDGRLDRVTFTFELAAPASVKVRILRDGRWVATPFAGPLPLGFQRIEWDGAKRQGRLLDGTYEVRVEATDAVTAAAVSATFTADSTPPKVRVLPGAPLRVWVNEPALLTLLVGGRSLRQEAFGPGETLIAWDDPPRRVRVVAWDPAGNKSAPVLRLPGK
jgi:hypothetical protein